MLFVVGILSVGCRESKEEVVSLDEKTDSKDLESLVNKLEVVTLESDIWLLDFRSVLGNRYQFNLQYKPFEGPLQNNQIPASQTISIEDTFFKEDPGKARFKLKDIQVRDEVGPSGHRPRNWEIIEDLNEQKKGRTYELRHTMPMAQRANSTQYDHTVVFRFNAIEDVGNQFKVEESGSFSLPHGGEETPYKLSEVKLEVPGPATRKAVSVVVQYEVDGEMKTREIHSP